jgi:hypothetical protein
MKLKTLLILILLFSCTEEKKTIIGLVRMVGNFPISEPVVTANNIDYSLPLDRMRELSGLQGKIVKLVGLVQTGELETADGKHKRRYYFIKPDSLIVLRDSL